MPHAGPFAEGDVVCTIMRIIGAVLTLLLVGGCSAVSSITGRDDGPVAYLASDPSGVLLVQWSDDGGRLEGSGQLAKPQEGEGVEVSASSFTLTGLRTDDDLSLTADFGLTIKQTWAGVLDGDTLTLQMPQDDGTLAPVSFLRSDTDAFNLAVESLRTTVAFERQVVADAESQAAQAKASAQASEDLSRAMSELASDSASLAAVPDLGPMISSAEQALAAEQQAFDAATGSSCEARGESISAVGDAYSAVLDELSDLRYEIFDLRYYADATEAGVEAAGAAGGDTEEGALVDYTDQLNEARSRAASAEQSLNDLDEDATAISDAGYALEYC